MPFKIRMYTMEHITLEKSLGKGAFGEVYKGTVQDELYGEVIEKAIALKQLHMKSDSTTSTTMQNFVAEVRSLAAVGTHENIVAFYGVAWDAKNYPSIVLEFVPGGHLESFLNEYMYQDDDKHGLENPALLSIALGILRGIDHIHSKGMIHRDIKPQNVLMDASDARHCPSQKSLILASRDMRTTV